MGILDYYPDLVDYSIYRWYEGDYYEIEGNLPLNLGEAYFVGQGEVLGSPPMDTFDKIVGIIDADYSFSLGGIFSKNDTKKRSLLEAIKRQN